MQTRLSDTLQQAFGCGCALAAKLLASGCLSQGGNPEQVTNGKHHLADVSWSVDEKHLVFGEESGNNRAIHVLDLPTRKISILPGSKGLFSPRWSPKGRYVAAIPGARQDRVVIFDYRTQKWSELAKALVGSPNCRGTRNTSTLMSAAMIPVSIAYV